MKVDKLSQQAALAGNLSIHRGIAVIQGDIGNHHQAVEDIKIDNEIQTMQDFVRDARRIAGKDNE
jgi:hypothetical protein